MYDKSSSFTMQLLQEEYNLRIDYPSLVEIGRSLLFKS